MNMTKPPIESRTTGAAQNHRRIIVVLPAYNEAACIGHLLDEIAFSMEEARLAYLVIVVDDGSTDETATIVTRHAASLPIRIERHESNQGLGATIRDGLVLAAQLAGPRDIVITMDADDTHTPGLILRMAREIAEGHDVVIASRYQSGSRTLGVPVHRRLLSYAGSWIFRILFPGMGIKDFTCGYRAYRGAVLQDAMKQYGEALFDQDGFQCMVDILLKLRHMNLIFGEVPFILRYDVKEGESKMAVGNTIIKTLGLALQRRFGA